MSETSTNTIQLYDVEEEENLTLNIENGKLFLNKQDPDYSILGSVRQLRHTSYGCRTELVLTFTECAASLPFVVHCDKFSELKNWLASDQSGVIFNMNVIKGEPMIAARAATTTASARTTAS